MRLTSASGARPVYYDRNPISTGATGFRSGPIINTTVMTYTVPSGRKAFMESAFALALRSAVATTAGGVIVQVNITPASLGGVLNVAYVEFIDNTLNLVKVDTETGIGVLVVGDQVVGQVQDTSTGGATFLQTMAKFTEFDA